MSDICEFALRSDFGQFVARGSSLLDAQLARRRRVLQRGGGDVRIRALCALASLHAKRRSHTECTRLTSVESGERLTCAMHGAVSMCGTFGCVCQTASTVIGVPSVPLVCDCRRGVAFSPCVSRTGTGTGLSGVLLLALGRWSAAVPGLLRTLTSCELCAVSSQSTAFGVARC